MVVFLTTQPNPGPGSVQNVIIHTANLAAFRVRQPAQCSRRDNSALHATMAVLSSLEAVAEHYSKFDMERLHADGESTVETT